MRSDVKVKSFLEGDFRPLFFMRIDVKVRGFLEGDFHSLVFHEE